MTGTPRRRAATAPANSALAIAIRRNNWELAALLLLDALATAARSLPPGAIDDILALISDEGAADDAAR